MACAVENNYPGHCRKETGIFLRCFANQWQNICCCRQTNQGLDSKAGLDLTKLGEVNFEVKNKGTTRERNSKKLLARNQTKRALSNTPTCVGSSRLLPLHTLTESPKLGQWIHCPSTFDLADVLHQAQVLPQPGLSVSSQVCGRQITIARVAYLYLSTFLFSPLRELFSALKHNSGQITWHEASRERLNQQLEKIKGSVVFFFFFFWSIQSRVEFLSDEKEKVFFLPVYIFFLVILAYHHHFVKW